MSYAWIDLGNGRQVYRRTEEPKGKRSHLPAPYTVSDCMEPVQHPCTGEYYSSKARFRAVTRAHGCVEVGNDPARLRPKQKTAPDRAAIRQSIKKAAEIVAAQ